jgi:hypothetical protein
MSTLGSKLALPERILAKIEQDGDCWIWQSSIDTRGYGRLWWNGRCARAHRVVYELMVGSIPIDREIDHLRNRPLCVNPTHLKIATGRENVLRSETNPCAINSRKTYCDHGHPLSGGNLSLYKGRRVCRACARRRLREHRAAKKHLRAA